MTDLSHVPELSSMPEGIRGTLAIYQATLELTRDCDLHPDLVSQTFGYLFFFSNASLLNTLMERGGPSTVSFRWGLRQKGCELEDFLVAREVSNETEQEVMGTWEWDCSGREVKGEEGDRGSSVLYCVGEEESSGG